MNYMKKIFSKIIAFIFVAVAAMGTKMVQAMVMYAPPEVFEEQAKANRICTAIIILTGTFAIVGLFVVIRFIVNKFRNKDKKKSNNVEKTVPVDDKDD